MFVIVTYDVNAKRVSKVMKICRKYFTHVQRSVFEGMISESLLKRFQKEVLPAMVLSEDNLAIYEIDSLRFTRKVIVGTSEIIKNII